MEELKLIVWGAMVCVSVAIMVILCWGIFWCFAWVFNQHPTFFMYLGAFLGIICLFRMVGSAWGPQD